MRTKYFAFISKTNASGLEVRCSALGNRYYFGYTPRQAAKKYRDEMYKIYGVKYGIAISKD